MPRRAHSRRSERLLSDRSTSKSGPGGIDLCSFHELPATVEGLGGRASARDFLQPWIHGLGLEGEYGKDCLVDPPERLAVGGALKRFEAERVFAGRQ